MGTCGTKPALAHSVEKKCVAADVTYEQMNYFIPPISSTGVIVKCHSLNSFIVAAYLTIPNTPLFKYKIYLPDTCVVPNINSQNEFEKFFAKKAFTQLESMFLHKRVCISNVHINKNGDYCAELFLEKQPLHIALWLILQKFAILEKDYTPDFDWENYYQKKPTLAKLS